MMLKKGIILLLLIFYSIGLYAQNDTLIFSNKDMLVGEVKSMNRGVLIFETDYSKSDFNIKWKDLIFVSAQDEFLITLANGNRYNGTIKSVSDAELEIRFRNVERILNFYRKSTRNDSLKSNTLVVPLKEIVYLSSLENGFWSRLNASLGLGFSLTKSSDLRTFNLRSNAGYLAERWKISSSFNNIRSSQNETQTVRRTDANLSFILFLEKDWYLIYDLSYLSNTEQLIQSRLGNKIGLGKYLVHTNRSYLGFQGGLNLNTESYFDDTPSRSSTEMFFGSELNLYDIGDFSLLVNTIAYSSFSQQGRFRTDAKVDLKYDFFKDFYIKFGSTINFDNQPAEGASNLDYIIQTTFGWSL